MTDVDQPDTPEDTVTLSVTLVQDCVALTISREAKSDITVFLSTKDAQRVAHALRDTAAIANLRFHLAGIGAASGKDIIKH